MNEVLDDIREMETFEIELNQLRRLAGIPIKENAPELPFSFTFKELCEIAAEAAVEREPQSYCRDQIKGYESSVPVAAVKSPTINDVLFGPIQ